MSRRNSTKNNSREEPSVCPGPSGSQSRYPSPSRSASPSVAGSSQPPPVSPSTPYSRNRDFLTNLEATRAANRMRFRSPQRNLQRPQAAADPRVLNAQDFPGGAVALAVQQRIDQEDRRDNYAWRNQCPKKQQKLREMQRARRRVLMEYLEELDNQVFENLEEILSTHNLAAMHNPVFHLRPEEARANDPDIPEPYVLPVWEPIDIGAFLRSCREEDEQAKLNFSDNFVTEENNRDPQMVVNNYSPMFPRREFDTREKLRAGRPNRPYAQDGNLVNYPPSPSRSRSRSPSPSRASCSTVAGSSQQTQRDANRVRFRSPQRGRQRPQASVGARVENPEDFPAGAEGYDFYQAIREQDRREVQNLHNMSLRAIQDLHNRQQARRNIFFENIENEDMNMGLEDVGGLVVLQTERLNQSNRSGASHGNSYGEDSSFGIRSLFNRNSTPNDCSR